MLNNIEHLPLTRLFMVITGLAPDHELFDYLKSYIFRLKFLLHVMHAYFIARLMEV